MFEVLLGIAMMVAFGMYRRLRGGWALFWPFNLGPGHTVAARAGYAALSALSLWPLVGGPWWVPLAIAGERYVTNLVPYGATQTLGQPTPAHPNPPAPWLCYLWLAFVGICLTGPLVFVPLYLTDASLPVLVGATVWASAFGAITHPGAYGFGWSMPVKDSWRTNNKLPIDCETAYAELAFGMCTGAILFRIFVLGV